MNPVNPSAGRLVLPHEDVAKAFQRIQQERTENAKFVPCGEERQTFTERHTDWMQWNRIN